MVRCLLVVIACACAAGNARHHVMMGDRAFARGNLIMAADEYDKAIATGDKRAVPPGAYARRAAVFLATDDAAAGLAWVDDVAERAYPGDPEILEQRALLLDATGQPEQAFALAERLVAADATRYHAQLLLGRRRFAVRDFARAQGHLDAYFRHHPGYALDADKEARVKLGYTYLHGGKNAEGKRELEAALLLAPHEDLDLDARKGLCAAYTGLGEYELAIDTCDLAIRLSDERQAYDATLHYNAAFSYYRLGRLAAARQVAVQYTGMRPDDARGWMIVADTFFDDKDWPSALHYYEEALRAGKNAPADLLERIAKTRKLVENMRKE